MEKNCHILPNCAPKRFSFSASFTLAEFSIFLYFVDIFAIHLKLFTWYQNVSRHWNMLLWLLRRSDFFVCLFTLFTLVLTIFYFLNSFFFFIFWILDVLTFGDFILKGLTLPKTACSVALVVSDSLRPYGRSQAPLSTGFSRQKYWRGLPCISYVSCIGRWVLYH